MGEISLPGSLERLRDMGWTGASSLGGLAALAICLYLFIALSIGQHLNLITPQILVLLGISGVTGLAAIQVTEGTEKADENSISRGFIQDIICDRDGPQLQRIQAVVWTLVLGVIFLWVAFRDFRFVAFDTNLLLLMGLAQSLYIGFKFKEGPKEDAR